jgi:hypothetical protein
MIRKLASLLRLAARDIEELSGSTPSDANLEEPEETTTASPQAEPAPPQPTSTPPTRFFSRFVRAERDRMHWLRNHLYIVGITLGLAIAVVVAEQWLIQAWRWLTSQVRRYWPELAGHEVALVVVGLALFYLIFGLRWLRSVDDFVRWVLGGTKRRPRLSALIVGVLLLVGLWIANNYGTWVILPFTAGQIETSSLTGEQVAVQLIAELNQVGVGNPAPVLILWDPQEPRTSSGSVTARRDLPFGECDTVLQGPGDFTRRSQRIPLTRVLAGSQGSRLDLGNLSIGAINIPSQIFTQFLLKLLPTGYREFSGQINETDGELEISVSSRNPSYAWRVVGPSDIFPEMTEYLALRMALDLNPELIKSSGLDAAPSDRDLAFAMGVQAFRQQDYRKAQAFFKLADYFAPLDEKVDAMLGLTNYRLALEQPGDDPSRFDAAWQAMEAAVREDPNGDSSLLRPYLVCIYHKAGLESQAQAQRAIFTRYLLRREFQERDVRLDELRQLPLRGPGRHLSVVGSDVIFVDNSGIIVGAAGQPLNTGLSLPGENPRQIGISGSNLLFISPDGAVLTYNYQTASAESKPTILIEGRALNGIQQIRTSPSQFGRTNLFLLNRFGQAYWCEPDAEAGSASACPPRRSLVTDPTSTRQIFPARQIFPVEDRLYMLAADGAVWYTEVDVIGNALAARQFTPPAPVQEIFVAEDGTLYLLYDNGNVWRYYEDGRPETEDLKLIDQATDTAQIFTAGGYLYLLKSNGAIWRISNPRNPTPGSDFTEISMPPKDMTIQEMFITADSAGEGAPGSRTIYLLTDQRLLLQGADTGNSQMTFMPVNIPSPAQTAGSQ